MADQEMPMTGRGLVTNGLALLITGGLAFAAWWEGWALLGRLLRRNGLKRELPWLHEQVPELTKMLAELRDYRFLVALVLVVFSLWLMEVVGSRLSRVLRG